MKGRLEHRPLDDHGKTEKKLLTKEEQRKVSW